MSTRYWLYWIIISIVLVSCNRKSVRETRGSSVITMWTDKYSSSSGSGKVIVITPQKNLNAFFSFKYNSIEKRLKGSFIGFLGVKVADFEISPSNISAKTITGNPVNIDSILNIAGIPTEFFLKCFAYDFGINFSKVDAIPLKEGMLVDVGNMEILLDREKRVPVKVVMLNKGHKIQVEYDVFRKVKDTMFPFKIVFSMEDKKLEIHFKNIMLE